MSGPAPTAIRRDTFDDFHVRGASAPEWNQRYAQLSSGEMRSRLVQVTAGGLHLFRKWMSERVVQEGNLPPGKICFALLGRAIGETPRMQGRALLPHRLIVLRGGEDFALQRPKGMELLAATIDDDLFRRLCDETRWSPAARSALAGGAIDVAPAAMARLRRVLDALAARAGSASVEEPAATPIWASHLAVDALGEAVEAGGSVREALGQVSASALVARCHRIVLAAGDAPPSIEALCLRLRVSRRTLQNSFLAVAGTTPLHYLRSLRLNAVRRQLLAAGPVTAPVTQAALARGFGHLGHFAADYKALFLESPSDSVGRRGNAP